MKKVYTEIHETLDYLKLTLKNVRTFEEKIFKNYFYEIFNINPKKYPYFCGLGDMVVR